MRILGAIADALIYLLGVAIIIGTIHVLTEQFGEGAPLLAIIVVCFIGIVVCCYFDRKNKGK